MGFKVLQNGKNSFQAVTQQDLLNGYVVKAMSVADPVSTTRYESQLNVDKADATADALLTVGVTVGSFTSGNLATIYTDGVYLMYAGGAISVGTEVGASGGDPLSVIDCTFTCTGSTAELLPNSKKIGTALSTAASGEQVAVFLNV